MNLKNPIKIIYWIQTYFLFFFILSFHTPSNCFWESNITYKLPKMDEIAINECVVPKQNKIKVYTEIFITFLK